MMIKKSVKQTIEITLFHFDDMFIGHWPTNHMIITSIQWLEYDINSDQSRIWQWVGKLCQPHNQIHSNILYLYKHLNVHFIWFKEQYKRRSSIEWMKTIVNPEHWTLTEQWTSVCMHVPCACFLPNGKVRKAAHCLCWIEMVELASLLASKFRNSSIWTKVKCRVKCHTIIIFTNDNYENSLFIPFLRKRSV